MTTSDSVSQRQVHNNQAITRKLRRLGDVALILSVIVLATTGIGTFILGRAPMTGWVLMLHAALTPLFALGLAWMTLTRAADAGFDGNSSRQGVAVKTLFWVAAASGLVVILSGVVPMTPIFGTDGQHGLYLLHRYSAMLLTGALIGLWLSRQKEKSTP